MRSSILNFKTSLVALAVVSAVAWIGYRSAQVQLGYSPAGEPASTWIGTVSKLRQRLYEKQFDPAKPTIFVVAGSNALFGLNSGLLREKTGYNVENYALHGGLHVDLLFSQIKSKVRPNDIVIAPIEWETRDVTFGSRFGYANYFQSLYKYVDLDLSTSYRLFTSVPLDRYLRGLSLYIFGAVDAKSIDDFYTYASLEAAQALRTGKEAYTHQALTASGDFNIDMPLVNPNGVREPPINVPNGISRRGLGNFDKWQTIFKRLGARLYIVSPAVVGSSSFEQVQTWSKIEKIRAQMHATSAPMNCDPVKAVFSDKYRFDTNYHPNATGANLWTLQLSDCINDLKNGTDIRTAPIDPASAARSIRERIAEQQAAEIWPTF